MIEMAERIGGVTSGVIAEVAVSKYSGGFCTAVLSKIIFFQFNNISSRYLAEVTVIWYNERSVFCCRVSVSAHFPSPAY